MIYIYNFILSIIGEAVIAPIFIDFQSFIVLMVPRFYYAKLIFSLLKLKYFLSFITKRFTIFLQSIFHTY